MAKKRSLLGNMQVFTNFFEYYQQVNLF